MQRAKFSVPLAGLALLTVVLLASGCGGPLKTGGTKVGGGPNPGVFPPSATPYGKTYGEWGDEWWKWLFAIPASDNPALDETGAKAGVAQSGPVWFLAGTFGDSADRACTVPADKAVLFGILNSLFWIPADSETVAGIRAIAKQDMDHATELEVTVDGVELQGLGNYRFQSLSSFFFTTADLFTFFGMNEQPGWEDGIPHEATSDGYWIMLKPLAPGEHTLKTRGKKVIPTTFPNVQVFESFTSWRLTVP